MLTFKVVFVWFDRGILKFQSEIVLPVSTPANTEQQMTANHGNQQESQLSAFQPPFPRLTAGAATQGTQTGQPPLREGT